MRLARAAVAEASRAPPAGADAASTALRGAARTVGFVSATLNPPDPVTPGETRHQCSHIATLPRPENTRLKTLDRNESRRNERARACVCCPAQFSFSFVATNIPHSAGLKRATHNMKHQRFDGTKGYHGEGPGSRPPLEHAFRSRSVVDDEVGSVSSENTDACSEITDVSLETSASGAGAGVGAGLSFPRGQ